MNSAIVRRTPSLRRNRFTPLPVTLALACAALTLAGCGSSSPATTTTTTTTTGNTVPGIGTIKVQVHGGQSPVIGSSVSIYAAGTGGYGTAATALNSTPFTTDSTGSFTLTGVNCTVGQQLYLYVSGGDGTGTGGGANSATGLMAVLGTCPATGSISATLPSVLVNEVTTVAAAYALAAYATDSTHIANSGASRALATQGMANAFANAGNMVSVATGAALATTPAGNGTVPQALIDSLANILAACVSTSSPSSTPCNTLLTTALASGTTGSKPADTATAAINIAHYPGKNVATLFPVGASGPFSPVLAKAPNDFTLGLVFTGGGIAAGGHDVRIDGSGNAWLTNGNALSEFSPLGVALSPSTGFTGGGLTSAYNMAFDLQGNVWVSNYPSAQISEFTSKGAPITSSTGITGGGLALTTGVAIDGNDNVWVADDTAAVTEITPTGGFVFGATGLGFNGTNLYQDVDVAIDSSQNVWIVDFAGSLTKLSNAGILLSPPGGYVATGQSGIEQVAIDNSQNVWVCGGFGPGVAKFSNAGALLSPSGGFMAGSNSGLFSIAVDGLGNVWVNDQGTSTNDVVELSNAGVQLSPTGTGYRGGNVTANASGIAVDGSGDVWVGGNANVTELIGVAAPVVTPLVEGVTTLSLGARP
jgi:hypothetical protein